jgi:AcrR family transcriptional regulator
MTTGNATKLIRQAHRELTETRILDAALGLLRRQDLEALTIADIAAEAGVTERTIYRHFVSREDLLKALWPHLQRRVGSSGFPTTARDVVALPPRLFANFDREEGGMRGSVYSTAGRDLRLAVNDERKAAFSSCVRDARPDLEGDALIRLAAVVQLLDSAFAWVVMKDFWGLDGAEAGRAASEAIAVLLGVRNGTDQRLDPAQKPARKEETSC